MRASAPASASAWRFRSSMRPSAWSARAACWSTASPCPSPNSTGAGNCPARTGAGSCTSRTTSASRPSSSAIGMDKWRDAKLPPKELAQKFDEVMRTRTAKEWEDIIAEIGSEGVICHTSAEWLQASAGAGIEDHRRLRRSGARAASAAPASTRASRPRRARCARRARRPMRIARRSCSELAARKPRACRLRRQAAKCCAPRCRA